MKTLSDMLDEDLLQDLAGDRYFQRGVDYFERGLVYSLAQYGERISAEVHGTETYQVQLWIENEDLYSRCTCPLGVEGEFCKHCVAVGLTWIDEPPVRQSGKAAPAKVGTTMEDVRDYLARQERDTLVRMILEQAMEDARWRDRLLMKAAAHGAEGVDINTFRRTLRNTISVGDFVDYYAAGGYASGVESVIDGLEELLEDGYASEVVELSEEAIMLLDDAINSVDDSDGYLNPIIDQVEDIHYQACEIAHPNPQALAERLFHMELESGFGFFHNAVESYADILGQEGQKTYAQLIDAELKKPSDPSSKRSRLNYRRSKLQHMKEKLVAAQGNLDDLVAVIAEDLSEPHRYQQIAQLYQDAGQEKLAIEWAERGLRAFSDSHYTGGLRDFLVSAYEKQGRFEDAVTIVWQGFSDRPSLYGYRKLKQQAEKAGSWLKWQKQALTGVKQIPQKYNRRSSLMDQSLLVEILLEEGQVETAWQEAQAGGCTRKLRLRLADLRADEHPEDALSIYQPMIEPLINQTDNQAYEQAIDLIVKVKALMVRLDQETEFHEFLVNLTQTYKRKRNFIKFLKQRNLRT